MTDQPTGAQADVTRLRKLAGKKRFDEMEALWMEAIARDDADVDGLLSVLETLARREEGPGVADSLFWYLLSEAAERSGPAEGVRIVRQAAAFLAGAESLRKETAAVYGSAHPEEENVNVMAAMTVLNPAVPFSAAVRRLDKLLALRPGTCALDTQLDKVGRVLALDRDSQAIELSFDDRPRSYDRTGIDKLEPLAADDLRSKVALDRVALEKAAWDDPGELIRTVLRTHGPRVEFRELKEHLREIVPASSWSKWWSAAKVRCKRDPLIEIADGAQPWLFLRSRPVAYEDELVAAFDAAPSTEARLAMVLDYLAECGDKSPDAAFCRHAAEELACGVEAWRQSEPAMAVGALAVVAELHRRDPAIPGPAAHLLEPILFASGDPAALFRAVASDRLTRSILDNVRTVLPASWHEVWAAALPACSQAVCEWIARALFDAGRAAEVRSAVGVVMARPERHPQALAWLWKLVCGDGPVELTGDLTRFDVAIALLAAANGLARDPALDKAAQQAAAAPIRSAITTKNLQWFREALKETDDDGAVRALHAAERNFLLGDHTRVRVMNLISQSHPGLFLKTVPPWEEKVVYTTAAGLKRRQEEFTHLVHVKMAANAKAIGEAAARGDLSENAEFTAALEERNLLTEKAARMEAELQESRLITPDMARSDTVTVGSTVVARDLANGETETMAFLGPWDSDPARGVYSYRAAMSLAFMGKAVGDRVDLAVEDGTRAWEILEIRPADPGPA